MESESYKHHDYTDDSQIPFEYRRDLGHGGFAFVQEVRERTSGNLYAVKKFTLPYDPAERQTKIDKAQEEARTIHLARHLHTASIMCTYATPRQFGIVMYPVADMDLDNFLQQPSTDELRKRISFWFGCLISGLAYLHRIGIRHRDIKPSNILIESGNVRLTDFGIATTQEGLTINTLTATRGTLHYRAPEVREVDESKLTIRAGRAADVFSLGAVFLDMLIVYSDYYLRDIKRQRDFEYSRHVDAVIKRLLESPRDVPWYAQILFLCQNMTEREPQRRPEIEHLRLCWSYKPLLVPPTDCECTAFRDESECHNVHGMDELLEAASRKGHNLMKLTAIRATPKKPSPQEFFELVGNYDNTAFVADVEGFIARTPHSIKDFFKEKTNYVKELAQKAADLADDPTTPIGQPDLLLKTVSVTLHQQVLYCDDSGSMKRDGRWDSQRDLANQIARITTRILPPGEGVALRFMNQDVDNSSNLDYKQIGDIFNSINYNGPTPIGTSLRSKILQPMVYDKIQRREKIAMPILVSIITDGIPYPEPSYTLVNAIVECGDQLEAAGYDRASVKFVIGRVGTEQEAAAFLNDLSSIPKIANVSHVVDDQMDKKMEELNGSMALDRWLIETLFAPIKDKRSD